MEARVRAGATGRRSKAEKRAGGVGPAGRESAVLPPAERLGPKRE